MINFSIKILTSLLTCRRS